MHRIILISLFVFSGIPLFAQKVKGVLVFEPKQVLTVTMDIKSNMAQQAGAQAINFGASGTATHRYSVKAQSTSQTTLQHEFDQLKFQFQGMGQQHSFDSEKKEDLGGEYGKQYSQLHQKRYDLTIDPTGKTIKAVPDKIDPISLDQRLKILGDILKDLTAIVYPPQKGEGSFFYVLPDYELGIGDSWADSTNSENEKTNTTSVISAITDSTITIDFKSTSSTSVTSQAMGREAKTSLNNITTGKIILDSKTRIIREKNYITESNGTTEAMGNSVPINGKTTVNIKVN